MYQTLLKLSQFRKNIVAQRKVSPTDDAHEGKSLIDADVSEVESYNGQVLEKNDDCGGDTMDIWHGGKLKFRKHVDDSYRSGGGSYVGNKDFQHNV